MIASLRSIWILLGALALGVALACGGDTEEAASTAKAPAEAWKPVPPAKRSPAVITTELPADFPSDVPLYPGAEVIEARVSPGGGTSVTLSVGDDVEKVASFLADSFAAEGWSTDTNANPDGSAIFADKTERRVAIMVRNTDEGTRIELVVVPIQ